MSGVNMLETERYTCLGCKRDFELEQVRRTWKCPVCKGRYVHVYVDDGDTGRIVLTRKAASEVTVGSVVHLPGMLHKDPYHVLAINPRKGSLGLALKAYGEYKIHPDEPVNCREGSW